MFLIQKMSQKNKNKSEIEKKKELEELRHKNRMKEIEAEKKAKKEVAKYKFDKRCEYHRIKNADIRRNIHRKRSQAKWILVKKKFLIFFMF